MTAVLMTLYYRLRKSVLITTEYNRYSCHLGVDNAVSHSSTRTLRFAFLHKLVGAVFLSMLDEYSHLERPR